MGGIVIHALRAVAAGGLLACFLGPGAAGAQEPAPADWRGEFEAVCVKTDVAMSLTSEELADLVARCDRLAERIGAEGEIVRKVYLKRLQSCRALFAYVLGTRAAAPAAVETPATPGTPPPEQKPTP